MQGLAWLKARATRRSIATCEGRDSYSGITAERPPPGSRIEARESGSRSWSSRRTTGSATTYTSSTWLSTMKKPIPSPPTREATAMSGSLGTSLPEGWL
jgi:hypothetical protein